MAQNPNIYNPNELDYTHTDSTHTLPPGCYYDEIYAQSHPGYLYTDQYGNTIIDYNAASTDGINHGSSSYSQLQLKAVNSSAYQNAYALFSKSPYQSEMWLQRLEALVLALQTVPPNPWDINDGYHNDVAQNSQLEQFYVNVANLVSEYQQWYNSLPAEQKEQYSSAGINIALDGGSQITGSSSASPTAQTSGFGDIANSTEDNALNYLSSVTGGFLQLVSVFNGIFGNSLSYASSLKSLANQRDISQDQLNIERQKLGLHPIQLGTSFTPYVIQQDVLSGPYNSARMKNSLDYFTAANSQQYEAVLNAAFHSEQAEVYTEMYGELGNIRLQSVFLNALQEKERASFELKHLNLEQRKTDAYSTAFDSLGSDLVESQVSSEISSYKESEQLSSLRRKVSQYKQSVISDWIQKANDSSNPHRWMYQTMLMKMSPNLMEYGTPFDAAFEYGSESTDIITKWLHSISEFKPSSKSTIKKPKR